MLRCPGGHPRPLLSARQCGHGPRRRIRRLPPSFVGLPRWKWHRASVRQIHEAWSGCRRFVVAGRDSMAVADAEWKWLSRLLARSDETSRHRGPSCSVLLRRLRHGLVLPYDGGPTRSWKRRRLYGGDWMPEALPCLLLQGLRRLQLTAYDDSARPTGERPALNSCLPELQPTGRVTTLFS